MSWWGRRRVGAELARIMLGIWSDPQWYQRDHIDGIVQRLGLRPAQDPRSSWPIAGDAWRSPAARVEVEAYGGDPLFWTRVMVRGTDTDRGGTDLATPQRVALDDLTARLGEGERVGNHGGPGWRRPDGTTLTAPWPWLTGTDGAPFRLEAAASRPVATAHVEPLRIANALVAYGYRTSAASGTVAFSDADSLRPDWTPPAGFWRGSEPQIGSVAWTLADDEIWTFTLRPDGPVYGVLAEPSGALFPTRSLPPRSTPERLAEDVATADAVVSKHWGQPTPTATGHRVWSIGGWTLTWPPPDLNEVVLSHDPRRGGTVPGFGQEERRAWGGSLPPEDPWGPLT